MKPFIKQLIVLFLLNSTQIGLTQTVSITNTDYHTTNDVVKIESHFYKEVPYKDAANAKLNDILRLEFKNGLIESKVEEIITSNISHHYSYTHTKSNKEFNKNYYRLNNEAKDYPSSTDYKLIEFNNTKIYIPKNGFTITKDIPNKVLEFSYKNSEKTINRKLILNNDQTITDTYSEYGSKRFTYNQKGYKIVEELEGINKEYFSYSKDGLLKTQKVVFNNFPNAPTLIFYYYFKDKKGNWTKMLKVKKGTAYEDVKITYSTRKITYKNGKTTGSKDYNITFINDKYKQYQTDVNNTVIMKDEFGCVKGDCEDGKGIFKYSNGDIYEGTYRGGLKDGKGTYTIPDGTTYTGEYLYGQMYGKGVLTTSSGDTYSGKFKKNQFDGEVTFFNAKENKKYIQTYYDGVLISSIEEINTIPKGLVWSKNADNSEYLLLKDGAKQIGMSFWIENSLYVYLTSKQEIYLLKDYKIKSADTYHNAEQLPYKFEHGAWYKADNGGAGIYNNKGINISVNNEIYKYATNGVDVIYKGLGEKETLFLKNFKTAIIYKVYPAEIYIPNNKTNTITETKVTGFQAEINACKQQANPTDCISNKLFENYTILKRSGVTNEKLIQTTAENMNNIGNYSIEILFETLVNTDKYLKVDMKNIIQKLDPAIKAEVKKHAQKVVDEYSRTHDN